MSFKRVVEGGRYKVLSFSDAQAIAAAFPDRSEGTDEDRGTRDLSEIEREAFQKAFEEGRRSGMEVAEKKMAAMLRKFSQSIAELAELRPGIFKATEREVVELSIEIAKKLVHREISIDEKIIATFVRVALDRLTTKSSLKVYLNPADFEVVQENLHQILANDPDRVVELKVDDTLGRGDCVVESDYGSVDARISEQFKEIENGLLSEF